METQKVLKTEMRNGTTIEDATHRAIRLATQATAHLDDLVSDRTAFASDALSIAESLLARAVEEVSSIRNRLEDVS